MDTAEIRDRQALEAATERFLRRRSRLNPDLRLLRWSGGRAVAKDWGGAPWPLRLYGAWSLRREWRILERVDGLPGLPRPLVRLPDAIVLSHLDGTSLSSRLAGQLPDDYFARLEALVASLHARRVVHLDLRQRRNVLLGGDGRPRILDFGASVDLERWGAVGRGLLAWLPALDRLAVLKLKAKYAPHQLTGRERRRARLARWARYAWPPNWLHGIKTRLRRRLR